MSWKVKDVGKNVQSLRIGTWDAEGVDIYLAKGYFTKTDVVLFDVLMKECGGSSDPRAVREAAQRLYDDGKSLRNASVPELIQMDKAAQRARAGS